MTQYNTLNVKWCNSQLNKLTSVKEDKTKVNLNLSSNVVGYSKDLLNLLLLLTNTQALRSFCK